MVDRKTEYLYLIRAVIEKKARHSLLSKGSSLAIFIFLFSESPFLMLEFNIVGGVEFLGVLPLIACWLMDAYHLREENIFTELYEKVRLDKEGVDLSIHPEKMQISCQIEIPSLFQLALSSSVFWFHSLMIVPFIAHKIYHICF